MYSPLPARSVVRRPHACVNQGAESAPRKRGLKQVLSSSSTSVSMRCEVRYLKWLQRQTVQRARWELHIGREEEEEKEVEEEEQDLPAAHPRECTRRRATWWRWSVCPSRCLAPGRAARRRWRRWPRRTTARSGRWSPSSSALNGGSGSDSGGGGGRGGGGCGGCGGGGCGGGGHLAQALHLYQQCQLYQLSPHAPGS